MSSCVAGPIAMRCWLSRLLHLALSFTIDFTNARPHVNAARNLLTSPAGQPLPAVRPRRRSPSPTSRIRCLLGSVRQLAETPAAAANTAEGSG